MATGTISKRQVEEFRTQGATVVRGVFGDWLETLRAGVDENIARPGPWVRHYTPEGGPGYFFGDYCNWHRIPEYRDFVFGSPLGRLGAELMESTTVRFFHEHVLVKEPGTRESTPWHHDQPYYPVDGDKTCSIWVALDPVARDVCPQFVAGSHQWGRWFMPTRFTGQEWDRDPADGLEPMPDIEAHRDQYTILAWELAPGDAIAFHFLTVHGAPPNPAACRRRGFAARLLGDDTTWAVRSGPTSPPFPELSARLAHGAPLEGIDEFPLIHRAS